MDLAKFVQLLRSQRLYFARADQFEDSWEGCYPSLFVPSDMTWESDQKRAEFLARLGQLAQEARTDTYISCWHQSDDESAAMWKIYTLQGQGIAVESNIGQLKLAFQSSPERVFIGSVHYGSFLKPGLVDGANGFSLFCAKREQFRYEEEVRAMVWSKLPPDATTLQRRWDPNRRYRGLGIHVDLSALITRVILSPKSRAWEVRNVQWLLKGAGLKNVVVKKSSMDDERPLLLPRGGSGVARRSATSDAIEQAESNDE